MNFVELVEFSHDGNGFLRAQFVGYNTEENFTALYNLTGVFLFADMLSYLGIFVLTIVMAKRYSQEHQELTKKLLTIASIFCYLSLGINVFSLFLSFELLSATNILIFSGLYSLNLTTQLFKIFLLLITGALYSLFPFKAYNNFRILELPLLLQITSALCITIISSNNFALTLLALEGFSLSLYIMAALSRTYGGITASVKYFAFGTLGSIFLFWGVVHIYTLLPTLSISVFNIALEQAYDENSAFITSTNFATSAIVFGFMIKLGAAPVHQWVADTYSGVHFYITTYFATFVKFILFVAFLRISAGFNCDSIIVQFTIISLLIGCFMSVNQTEIKRLLAYSSIVHVGFLFMGDAISSMVYIFTYLVSSLVIFSIFLNAEIASKELVYMNDVKCLRRGGFFNIFALVVALASSAGLPPFAGFYGKFLVWTSLIEDIYLTNSGSAYTTLFVSVLITLITIFYYMRVIAYLFLDHDAKVLVIDMTLPTVSDFIVLLFSTRGVLVMFIIFWSFFQSYALELAQVTFLF